MIEIPGRIPIFIHPYFWVFSSLIGFLASGSLQGTLIWVGIIFVSVLIHEFGHALAAVFFKQKAKIQLVAMGGLTSFEGEKLGFFKQFIITLCGPLFGFLLFVLATVLLPFATNAVVFKILKITQMANLFWTFVNLLPVLPLDGGQLLRIILEASFGVKGFKITLFVGMLISAAIALYFFMIQAFLIGALFFIFAYQSFDAWIKSRFINKADRDEEITRMMFDAENALQEGRFYDAKTLLEQVRQKSKGGMLEATSGQYLAFIAMKEGRSQDAYDLLLPIQDHLAEDSQMLLHQLAAHEKNWELVAKLSEVVFQFSQNPKIALNNARAFAYLAKPKEAGGWLQTAWSLGGIDLNIVLLEEEFKMLKNNPEFEFFLKGLK